MPRPAGRQAARSRCLLKAGNPLRSVTVYLQVGQVLWSAPSSRTASWRGVQLAHRLRAGPAATELGDFCASTPFSGGSRKHGVGSRCTGNHGIIAQVATHFCLADAQGLETITLAFRQDNTSTQSPQVRSPAIGRVPVSQSRGVLAVETMIMELCPSSHMRAVHCYSFFPSPLRRHTASTQGGRDGFVGPGLGRL